MSDFVLWNIGLKFGTRWMQCVENKQVYMTFLERELDIQTFVNEVNAEEECAVWENALVDVECVVVFPGHVRLTNQLWAWVHSTDGFLRGTNLSSHLYLQQLTSPIH